VHPQYASNGWLYLSYSETLPGYTPPSTPPADANPPAVAGASRQQPPGGRGRGGPPDPQEVVFNQFGRVHEVIDGPDGYLYTTLQLPGRFLSESTPGMVVRLMPVQQYSGFPNAPKAPRSPGIHAGDG